MLLNTGSDVGNTFSGLATETLRRCTLKKPPFRYVQSSTQQSLGVIHYANPGAQNTRVWAAKVLFRARQSGIPNIVKKTDAAILLSLKMLMGP